MIEINSVLQTFTARQKWTEMIILWNIGTVAAEKIRVHFVTVDLDMTIRAAYNLGGNITENIFRIL